jgi:cytoskeleton protein RodZ
VPATSTAPASPSAPAPAPLPGANGTAVVAPPPPPPAGSTAAAPAAPSPAGGETPRVYGVVNAPSRIVIRALSDSWVQVRDSDQSLLLTRLLHAGDSYRAPDKPGLTMRTGNGAGLEITVDGRPAPGLGGGLRRNVILDADRLLAGKAVGE